MYISPQPQNAPAPPRVHTCGQREEWKDSPYFAQFPFVPGSVTLTCCHCKQKEDLPCSIHAEGYAVIETVEKGLIVLECILYKLF